MAGRLLGDVFPMCRHFWRVAMDLEPAQRIPENGPSDQAFLSARVGSAIAKPPLKADHLTQALHIASRDREAAETRAFLVGVMTRGLCRESERRQKRSQQDCVRDRFG
jgi:hypothetical protein